jgi:hypothetical protein
MSKQSFPLDPLRRQLATAELTKEDLEILDGIRRRYAGDHNIVTLFTIIDRLRGDAQLGLNPARTIR